MREAQPASWKLAAESESLRNHKEDEQFPLPLETPHGLAVKKGDCTKGNKEVKIKCTVYCRWKNMGKKQWLKTVKAKLEKRQASLSHVDHAPLATRDKF